MRLQNTLQHMKNASVKVNGTRYEIDADGIADVSSEEDAKKLLTNKSAWQLLSSMIEPPPSKKEAVVINEIPEAEDAEAGAVFSNDADSESDLDAEYPDPTEDMTLPELKRLADVYQVSYSDQPKKAALINRIMSAMYPNKE